jgi:hypothetical protein
MKYAIVLLAFITQIAFAQEESGGVTPTPTNSVVEPDNSAEGAVAAPTHEQKKHVKAASKKAKKKHTKNVAANKKKKKHKKNKKTSKG